MRHPSVWHAYAALGVGMEGRSATVQRPSRGYAAPMTAPSQDLPAPEELLTLELRRQRARTRGNVLLLLAILTPIVGPMLVMSVVILCAVDSDSPWLFVGLGASLVATIALGVFSFLGFRRERTLNRALNDRYPPGVIQVLPFTQLVPGQCFGSHRVVEASPTLLRVRHREGALVAILRSLGALILSALFVAAVVLMLLFTRPGGGLPVRGIIALCFASVLLFFYSLRITPIGWAFDAASGEFSLLTVRLGLLFGATRVPAGSIGRPQYDAAGREIPVLTVQTAKGPRIILELHPPGPRWGIRTPDDAARHTAMNRWIADNFAFHFAGMLPGNPALTRTS